MKKGIHPENYRLVAFKDMSNNDIFVTKSTVDTKDTVKVDGVDYPLVKLEISRTSHPYYTGKTKLVDTAGRIDKFKSRYSNISLKKNAEEKLSSEEDQVAKENPVSEETPSVEEIPAVEETPAPEETPAVEETPAPEETPAAEKPNDFKESQETEKSKSLDSEKSE